MAYAWDPATRRYRDLATGDLIAIATLIEVRDQLVADMARRADDVAAAVAAGTISVPRFVTLMRGIVKDVTIAEYMLGRGGRAQMTAADRGRIGGMLRAQYRYLDAFSMQIANGEVTEAQLRNRATMYAESARGAYERGYASAWEISLPTFPGEQSCRSRCRCRWEIEEQRGRGEVHATWIRAGGADSCEDCERNAGEYAPLIFRRPMV